MFYQSDNSLDSDLLKVESGRDFSFPLHLHGSFELITVTEGEMTVTVDEKHYTLVPGKAVLIFPNQLHALHTESSSRHVLCIFSPQLVRAYNHIFTSRIPEDALFEVEPFYVERLVDLRGCRNVLQIKGLLYSLIAAFDVRAVYRERERKKEYLLLDIFQFVADHYRGSCSLQDIGAPFLS